MNVWCLQSLILRNGPCHLRCQKGFLWINLLFAARAISDVIRDVVFAGEKNKYIQTRALFYVGKAVTGTPAEKT